MRIVGGQFRGRTLIVPKTRETRPTMDRTREAVFNLLLNASWAKRDDGTSLLRDAVVLDVFAGSGAYGLEALSHGAQHVTFFENGPRASDAIEQNIFKLEVTARAKIMQGNVMTVPLTRYPRADIAFFDPPYGEDLIEKGLKTLNKKGWLSNETLCVIETENLKPDPLPDGFDIVLERAYGKSKIIVGYLKK